MEIKEFEIQNIKLSYLKHREIRIDFLRESRSKTKNEKELGIKGGWAKPIPEMGDYFPSMLGIKKVKIDKLKLGSDSLNGILLSVWINDIPMWFDSLWFKEIKINCYKWSGPIKGWVGFRKSTPK